MFWRSPAAGQRRAFKKLLYFSADRHEFVRAEIDDLVAGEGSEARQFVVDRLADRRDGGLGIAMRAASGLRHDLSLIHI